MEKEKKKKRKIWKILIGVLIFIVVALAVAVLYLDSIIAGTMRTIGTQATGTKLAVESVNLSLLRGELRINMMSIANPPDYKEKQAFSFDLVHVDLDVSTLLSDTLVVSKVEIANIKIDYEPTLKGGSNLNDIQNNIMKYIGADKAKDKVEKESEGEEVESDTPKKEKKIIIESFIINKGTIMFSSNMVKTSIPIPLPRVELNDIGKDSNMGEAFADIYSKVMQEVVNSVGKQNMGAITKDLPSATKKLGKDITKSIGDLF